MTRLLRHKKHHLILIMMSALLMNCTQAEQKPYQATTLGEVEVSVFNGKTIDVKHYPISTTFALAEDCLVCMGQGTGSVKIDHDQYAIMMLSKHKPCVYLPIGQRDTFSKKIKEKIAQVFPSKPKGVDVVSATHRGDAKYTQAIYLNDSAYLVIEETTWFTSPSRLPIVLEVISPKAEVVDRFESNSKGLTSFIIPRQRLEDKEGYTLKISNQRKEVLLESLFYLNKKKEN